MKEVSGTQIRQRYSSQFKDQALERVARDGVRKAADDLGIAEAMLYSWRSQQRQGRNSFEQKKLEQAEFSRLKRENARLSEENAFLACNGKIQVKQQRASCF